MCALIKQMLKMYGGMELQLHAVLSWHYTEVSGQPHAPGTLSLRDQSPVPVVGPRASLGEEKNYLSWLRIKPQSLRYPACSLVTVLNELSQPPVYI